MALTGTDEAVAHLAGLPLPGFLGAVASAVCYGIASVLQAIGARRTAEAAGLDLRLLARVAAQRIFLLGVGLDIVGFLLSLGALRTLPLFVVEPVVAANLVVTAVLAARFLGVGLAAREWLAVTVTCTGLIALGSVGAAAGASRGGTVLHLGLIVAAAVLVPPATLAARLDGNAGAAALGSVAGLSFAVLGLAVRVVPSLRPAVLLLDPATYAVIVSGVLGFLCYTTALQRGRVTTATATMVTGETVVPAIAGVVLLGDRTQPGLAWLGVLGFGLAVGGALALARFGEPSADPLPGDAAPDCPRT